MGFFVSNEPKHKGEFEQTLWVHFVVGVCRKHKASFWNLPYKVRLVYLHCRFLLYEMSSNVDLMLTRLKRNAEKYPSKRAVGAYDSRLILRF